MRSRIPFKGGEEPLLVNEDPTVTKKHATNQQPHNEVNERLIELV
jgi:hypothetical protein